MSGSNDILAQSLLAQVRQRPQQSVQSRLAAQMLQQSQSNEPIYNGNAGIALRAGQGLLAGFLSQYAQQGDDDREAKRVYNAEQYQAQRDRAADAEMQPLLDAVRGGIGGGAARPAPAEAPAMPGPVAQAPLPASAPAGDPSLPRGLRNNNPLNLSYVEGQPGVLGSDGRFGRYATPEDGIAASVRQLQMYGQRGLTTLPQIINRWAPPSENDTGAYVSRVAQAAGLPTDQPLNLQDPDTLTRLVGAMATVENGRGIDPMIARRGVDAGLALPVNGAPAAAGGSPPPALPPPGPGQGAPPPPAGVDFRALAVQAAASRNPRAQGLAPLLMQMATANERPTLATAAPGSAIYDRSGRIVSTIPDRPQQPSENERLIPQWRALNALGDRATPQQVQERDLLARTIGGSGTTVNTNVNTERTFQGELAQRGAAQIAEMRQGGTVAVEGIRTAQRIENLLADGAITGTGADARLAFERAFATAGLVDGQRVANTEQLQAELARSVLPLVSSLRGPTSDRDLAFLREAAAGNIAFTAETMRRIATLTRDYSERQITTYNDVIGPIYGDPSLPPAMRQLYAPLVVPPRDDARPAPGQGGASGAPSGGEVRYDARGRRVAQ